MSVENAKQILQQGIEAARQKGYTQRDDGRWETPDGRVLDNEVDPLPVKRAAIKASFQQAVIEADQLVDGVQPEKFDIWTEINQDYVLREGEPIENDFERAVERWDQIMDKPVIKNRVEEIARER